MKADNLIARWMRLGRLRQLLLIEASIALAAASAAVRLLPFKRAVRLGSRSLSAVRLQDVTPDARWAVKTAAHRLPWKAVCFQQGLALQWMLRRRGVDARLHYGIARDEAGELEAHVWITAGDRVIIGEDEAPRFQRVAIFP